VEGAPTLPSEWFEKHRFTLVIILGLAILILQIVQLLEGRGGNFTGTAAGADDRSARLVYISGAVVDPGVYEVQPGDRIQDVLTAAGGPSSGASLTRTQVATIEEFILFR